MDMKTRVVLSGLLTNGHEHSEVLTGDLSIDAAAKCADWRHVYSGSVFFPNGVVGTVDPTAIEELNGILEECLYKPVPETSEARFDRIKREAHERRARENETLCISTPESRKAAARMYSDLLQSQGLASAMHTTLPLDVPLLAGPRPGMER